MDYVTCIVCGEFYMSGEDCPDCVERYNEDIRTGHVPPQFREAGVEFTFQDWHDIRGLEVFRYQQRDSEQQIKKIVGERIQELIARHRTPPPTPQQIHQQKKSKVTDFLNRIRTY